MTAQIKFTPLDLQTWERGQMFYYFSQIASTGYALTAELDITKMKSYFKRCQHKIFSGIFVACYKNLKFAN